MYLFQPLSDSDVDLATETMIGLLQDTDSYVYLSVLTTISRLADLPFKRARVFRSLLMSFSACSVVDKIDNRKKTSDALEINGVSHIDNSTLSPQDGAESGSEHLSPRVRALVGEALACVLRRAGDAAPPLVPSLVVACIRVVRDRATDEAASLVQDYANLRTMIMTKNTHTESSQEEVPYSSETAVTAVNLTEAVAKAADIALLRQSAMSLLAESVVCAGWTASKYLLDILDIAVGVLALEGRNHSTQISSSIHRYVSKYRT